MNPESRECENCKNQFTIESEDFAFYEMMKVPAPTWCPECRFVRRLMMRNERALSKRKCDSCGKEKILIYAPDSPYTVYCFQCWWSDRWDGGVFGRPYDFSRTFFDQFAELVRSVPRLGIIQQGSSVNSEYTNRASDNKDCYLIFASANNEDCSYGEEIWDSKSSSDCFNLRKSERCFECIDCFECNNLRYSAESNSCNDSWFLYNCRNCSNCFGCVNLRNKTYCFFNEQLSKDEYEKRVAEMGLGSLRSVENTKKELAAFRKKFIVPCLVAHQSVNVSGNWIEQCKNAHSTFSGFDIENGKFTLGTTHTKDVMDVTYWGMHSERLYECANVGRQCANVRFTHESWDQLLDAEYCINCFSSSNLFGCVGLRNKKYCILNRQYTKEEYEELVPKIIVQMGSVVYRDKKDRTYKYGEMFPPEILPFAYNETIAQDYFPMTKEAAEAKGYRWKEPEAKTHKSTISELPEDIKEVPESIVNEIIGCAHDGKCTDQCTRAFKVRIQDLSLYRLWGVPLPRLCPNCRHYERLRKRNPLKLWARSCQCAGKGDEAGKYSNTSVHSHGDGHCPNHFETSYSPERTEIVYCEDCYKAEVV